MNLDRNIGLLERKAYESRRTLGLDNDSPVNFNFLKERLNRLTNVEYPLSKGFCGLIYKIDTDSAVIIINSNLTLGKQNFTFAHEIYHLHYSTEETKICTFNESFMHRKKDEEEVLADIFASYFLMPRFAFLDFFHKECNDEVSIESVIKLENYFRVNRFTVVSRLQFECGLTNQEAKKLMAIDKEKIVALGYSFELYEKKASSAIPSVNGYYNILCEKLLTENKITENKYKEIIGVFGME